MLKKAWKTQNNLDQIVTKMHEIESVVTTAVKAQQAGQIAQQTNQGPIQGS